MRDNRNDPAGNGVGSQNVKAGSLSVSSLADGTVSQSATRRDESSLTFEDREAARAAGYEAGMNHKFGIEVDGRARALLVEWSNESRNMATHYAAKVGPHWLALISDCGELDD